MEFKKSDALSEASEGDFFAVISNPPYVLSDVYENLEPERAFEPRGAFVGGGIDGADFYRAIVRLWHERIPKDGFILFEIGFDQAEALLKIAEEYSMNCEIKKDYSANDRMALLRKK